MSEWKEYKLGEIITLNYGKALVTSKRIPGEIPVYSSSGVSGWHNKSLVNSKGIIVGRKGSIGNIFLSEKPFYCIDTAYFVLPEPKKYEFKFIYYLLKSLKLDRLNEDSALPGLNRNTAYNQRTNLPDLPTQKAIAEILSSLDDKIELNNKINQNLEQLAQTIFKRWFVDFEFPDENGNPYKSSGGKMVESELGLIPEGWNTGVLNEEFDIIMGQSPKGSSYNEEGNGKIFFQGRTDFGFRFPTIRKYTTEPKKIAQKFDVLLSVRAPVGDINMAKEECCIGRGLASISHHARLYSYVYYKMLDLQSHLKTYDNEGTVFGAINKDTLGKIKTIIPPRALSGNFEDKVKPINDLIYSNHLNTVSLTKTRDTLLPKLITGKLEISQTE